MRILPHSRMAGKNVCLPGNCCSSGGRKSFCSTCCLDGSSSSLLFPCLSYPPPSSTFLPCYSLCTISSLSYSFSLQFPLLLLLNLPLFSSTFSTSLLFPLPFKPLPFPSFSTTLDLFPILFSPFPFIPLPSSASFLSSLHLRHPHLVPPPVCLIVPHPPNYPPVVAILFPASSSFSLFPFLSHRPHSRVLLE